MSSHRIGAHVSAAGGVEKAIERAAAIGANCVQVFSGSPRVWQRPQLEAFDPTKIAAISQEKDVQPIFTHSLYLVNLASDNPELVAKSVKALCFDLAFDARIGGAGVIVHLGSHQGRGWEAVKEQVAQQVGEIIAKSPHQAHFLIENAAGQKGKIGGDLDEVRWLLDQVASDQLGWCFDTCHASAAGYGLGQKQGQFPAERENAERLTALEEIERLELWSSLRCVHVNDSKDPFGSGRDRHQNLGDGTIPTADLQYFLNHDLINDKPLILEVPGMTEVGPDQENVNRLKKLVAA